MTNHTPLAELTGKGQNIFAAAYAAEQVERDARKVAKAIRKLPTGATQVIVKVQGQGELTRFLGNGWTLLTALSLGRGVGPVTYQVAHDLDTLPR